MAIAPVVRLNQTFVQTWAILCGTVRSGNWLFLWIFLASQFFNSQRRLHVLRIDGQDH